MEGVRLWVHPQVDRVSGTESMIDIQSGHEFGGDLSVYHWCYSRFKSTQKQAVGVGFEPTRAFRHNRLSEAAASGRHLTMLGKPTMLHIRLPY